MGERSLLVSADWCQYLFNMGVAVFRRSAWTFDIIDRTLRASTQPKVRYDGAWEQNSMNRAYRYNALDRAHIHVIVDAHRFQVPACRAGLAPFGSQSGSTTPPCHMVWPAHRLPSRLRFLAWPAPSLAGPAEVGRVRAGGLAGPQHMVPPQQHPDGPTDAGAPQRVVGPAARLVPRPASASTALPPSNGTAAADREDCDRLFVDYFCMATPEDCPCSNSSAPRWSVWRLARSSDDNDWLKVPAHPAKWRGRRPTITVWINWMGESRKTAIFEGRLWLSVLLAAGIQIT